jgi:hypothetical protein
MKTAVFSSLFQKKCVWESSDLTSDASFEKFGFMFLSLKIVNSASIDALMSHSPLRDIIRRRFLFIPAGMKRKDMYSTVHFHVSSFVHVHGSFH